MATMNNSKQRPGKTLIINTKKDYDVSSYKGIKNIGISKKGAKFVTFESTTEAEAALHDLRERDILSRYSYYYVFFKIKNYSDTSNYDEIKQQSIEAIQNFDPESNVLYFKLYRRNETFTGSGDLTLDTMESLDKLLTQKQLKLENGIEIYFRAYDKSKRGRNSKS